MFCIAKIWKKGYFLFLGNFGQKYRWSGLISRRELSRASKKVNFAGIHPQKLPLGMNKRKEISLFEGTVLPYGHFQRNEKVLVEEGYFWRKFGQYLVGWKRVNDNQNK